MSTETEEKLFEVEELYEMFNTSFLPKLQEFARRAKNARLKEQEVAHFNVKMTLQFSELNKPLTFQMVEDKIHMQLQPITKEDLERAEKEKSTKNENPEKNT